MVRTECDKCKHEFTLKAQDILTIKTQDLEVNYFMCEKCKDIFITNYEDSYLRLQERRYTRLMRTGKYEIATRCAESMNRHLEYNRAKVLEQLRKLHG